MGKIDQPSRGVTALVLCFICIHTLVVSVAALIFSPIIMLIRKQALDKTVRHFIWLYGKGYVFFTRSFVPASLGWEGKNPFPLETPAIVVMNHFSILDLYYLGLLLCDGNIAFVTQRRPFLIKLYAPFMSLAKYIDMREGDFDSCLKQCKEHFANGNRVLFFPESGRSRDGKLKPFKVAPFRVATICNVPVIPFCIAGTETLLPASARLITPTTVSLRILQAQYPDQFTSELPHRELMKAVHKAMKHSLEKQQLDRTS